MKVDVMDRESPYLMAAPPTSPGRALLSRALEHYCVLHFGLAGAEIATAFGGAGEDGETRELALAIRLLGELVARGDVQTWARPIGGGEPVRIKPTLWELDDYRDRFATSAMNLASPFDRTAPATHWIFVDLADWNRVVEMSLGVPDMASSGSKGSMDRSGQAERPASASVNRPAATTADADRLVRLPEVLSRTSLSKATIYRRMDAGRFPRNVNVPGDPAVWRDHEVAAWIAAPR